MAAASIVACGAGPTIARRRGGRVGLGTGMTIGRGGGTFAWGRSASSASRSSEPRAFRAEPRAPFSVVSHHQAESWLGSFFTSLTEPSHEPAQLGSIPPLLEYTPDH
jgi:hypothetical protein